MPSMCAEHSVGSNTRRADRAGYFITSVAGARRLGWAVLIFIGKLTGLVLLGGFLCATLVRCAPGYGVDEEVLDTRLSAESIQALRNSQTPKEGLGAFYVQYWRQVLHGDLGFSHSLQEPVMQLITERSPQTVKSVGFGLLLGWALGLPMAILSVFWRSEAVDVTSSFLASVLLCIPSGVLALLCVLWQAPGRLVLGLIVFPKVFEYSRNLLLRSAAMPHVITARAKGLSALRILVWHTFPPSVPQLMALGGMSMSVALAGAIPVEVLCDIPGIGQLAWTAALSRDLNLIVIITLGVTTITLFANSIAELGSRHRGAEPV